MVEVVDLVPTSKPNRRTRRIALFRLTKGQRAILAAGTWVGAIGNELGQAQIARAFLISTASLRAAQRLSPEDRELVWNGKRPLFQSRQVVVIQPPRPVSLEAAWIGSNDAQRRQFLVNRMPQVRRLTGNVSAVA
jgi:hypothetical protein